MIGGMRNHAKNAVVPSTHGMPFNGPDPDTVLVFSSCDMAPLPIRYYLQTVVVYVATAIS